MNRLKTVIVVCAVALGLVAGIDYTAAAATGKSIIAGKLTKTKKQTTLASPKAKSETLFLKSRPGFAPLKVNSSTRVTNLNSDQVDGLHATDLQTTAYQRTNTTASSSGGANMLSYTLPAAPAGNYLVTVDASPYRTTPIAGGDHDFACGYHAIGNSSPSGLRGLTTTRVIDPSLTGLTMSFTLQGAPAGWRVLCQFTDSGAWSNTPSRPTVITLIPLDRVVRN
ncbi:hypothetical protein GCM10009788_25820 [Nocardioides humi]|uniref:Secreted protein n=1 Tax=Nocardioides humi TaxID=449461 RepID=A0ABN2AJY2_9ACTN